MLSTAGGRSDVDKLDFCLSALEIVNGIVKGSTPVAVLITKTVEALFRAGDYRGAPRVVALTWEGEILVQGRTQTRTVPLS
jgi:citrate lyase subunit beta/citryl-CoA lyase